MIFLTIQSNDNINFIQSSNKILNQLVENWKPDEVFTIKIDNWFDEKCLSFQGTQMHDLASWDWSSQNITLPPFQ